SWDARWNGLRRAGDLEAARRSMKSGLTLSGDRHYPDAGGPQRQVRARRQRVNGGPPRWLVGLRFTATGGCMTRNTPLQFELPGYAPLLAAAAALAFALVGASTAALPLASPAAAQPVATDRERAAARAAYAKALSAFRAILAERRRQIERGERLPDRPGQALYLARNDMISTYKDLTDLEPWRIGRSNRF